MAVMNLDQTLAGVEVAEGDEGNTELAEQDDDEEELGVRNLTNPNQDELDVRTELVVG